MEKTECIKISIHFNLNFLVHLTKIRDWLISSVQYYGTKSTKFEEIVLFLNKLDFKTSTLQFSIDTCYKFYFGYKNYEGHTKYESFGTRKVQRGTQNSTIFM